MHGSIAHSHSRNSNIIVDDEISDVVSTPTPILSVGLGGGGMRRKRHHTLSKIINRLRADALSGMGSRTVWSVSSVY